MSRKFQVLHKGNVYRFGKRELLALLKAVASGHTPDQIEGGGAKIDVDLGMLTEDSAKEKYLDIVRETEFE
jgi:hypothetical protein